MSEVKDLVRPRRVKKDPNADLWHTLRFGLICAAVLVPLLHFIF